MQSNKNCVLDIKINIAITRSTGFVICSLKRKIHFQQARAVHLPQVRRARRREYPAWGIDEEHWNTLLAGKPGVWWADNPFVWVAKYERIGNEVS